MTFLAPLFFYAGLAVAAGALAIHFIVTRQPSSSPLPTVRFIPVARVRVTTISRVPHDLRVLIVRMLLAIVIGAALARPVLIPARRPVARVIVVDASRSVGHIQAIRDSAHALLATGDALVVFDSAARVVTDRYVVDTLARLTRTTRDGKLSPALIAALRAAATLRDHADSIELDVVSPLGVSEIDGATASIRALWPGRIRMIRVAAAIDSAPRAGLTIESGADDAVMIAAQAAGITIASASAGADTRVQRGVASPSDSAWVVGGPHVLVRWPASTKPAGFAARPHIDTAGAVVAGETALVTPMERRWTPDTTTHAGRTVARWVDGEPAAIERIAGAGCIRDVAIPIPSAGDVILRPAFAHLLRELTTPCAAMAGSPRLDDAQLRALAGAGGRVASARIAPPDLVATPLVVWLLAAALVFALLELVIRRDAPMSETA